jgi:L-asparaginase
MSQRCVILIGTGGTISSGAAAGGAVPRFSADDLLASVASRGLDLPEDTAVKTIEFSRVLSANMTPTKMYELAGLVQKALARPDIDGAVVTHGTGTIEETSFLVDLYHSSPKPVVFTGAMRPSTTSDTDGPRNLRDAITVAAHEEARGKGVLLVMNGVIFSARDATKSHSSAVDTFQAEFGPLGAIEPGDEPSFFRSPERRQVFSYRPPEPNVDLVRFYTGMDGRFVRASVQGGARGLVVEGTGMGNVNEAVAAALKDVIQQGLVVLLASRCSRGTTYPLYDTVGAGADLARAGVFFSSYLSGLKSRVLLCVALGLTQDRQHLSTILSGGMIS